MFLVSTPLAQSKMRLAKVSLFLILSTSASGSGMQCKTVGDTLRVNLLYLGSAFVRTELVG